MNKVALIAVVRNDGAVVLQHRDNIPGIDFPGLWCLPGGQVEEGETEETAALREFKEETGYAIDKMIPLGRLSRQIDPMNLLVIKEWVLFIAKFDDKQEIKCLEGQEITFVEPNNFDTLELIPNQLAFIKQASIFLKNNNFSLQFDVIVFQDIFAH